MAEQMYLCSPMKSVFTTSNEDSTEPCFVLHLQLFYSFLSSLEKLIGSILVILTSFVMHAAQFFLKFWWKFYEVWKGTDTYLFNELKR